MTNVILCSATFLSLYEWEKATLLKVRVLKMGSPVHFRLQATFFFSFFNWRLITLQYCGGFCQTLTRITHGCICVPHPTPPHPIPQGHPSALGWHPTGHVLNCKQKLWSQIWSSLLQWERKDRRN